VKALRLAKEDLDNKKKQMEAKKADLLALKEDLDNKKKDFQDQSYTKQNLLAQTQSSELKYRTLLNSLRQQQLAIESELKNYEEQARRRLAQQNKIEEGGVALSWPAPSRYITSGFRDPDYPYRNIFEHNAIDIRAGQGTPIVAAASGYIGRATHCTTASCYNYVLIIHNGNFSTVYGHLSNVLVTTDKFVNRGDVIGYSGGTPGTVGAGPFVTGPHLHFEVRLNGIPVNPIGYLIQ
jgi:murein DD-endopeptidase MepM/ murein hydrolase activator NlpD